MGSLRMFLSKLAWWKNFLLTKIFVKKLKHPNLK